MKRKNIVAMVTSLALVGVVAVGGTLALLTSNTPTVTNTFTIGNDYPSNALTLDEADVEQVTTAGADNYGGYQEIVAPRVTENYYENLVPETTLDKDPTFHLAAESPTSWIVAYVTGINALDGKVDVTTLPDTYDWVKLNMGDATTNVITSAADLEDGYYLFNTTVAAGNSTDALFAQMTVQEDALGETLSSIVVKGVAVASVTGDWAKDGAAVVAQIDDMLE